MKWIGLTGGIATGKSTVAGFLREQGVPVICADQLSRDAVAVGSQGLAEIVRVFGKDVLHPDGSLDRKALGAKVFGFPAQLRQLESIVHPEVRRLQKQHRDALTQSRESIAVYDVPLLFEKNLEGDYDAIIVVACSPETQLKRLMDRDRIDETQARKRIDSQLPIDEKVKKANFVIRNEGGVQDLRATVATIVTKLRQL